MGRERGVFCGFLIAAHIAAGCSHALMMQEEVLCRISVDECGFAVKAADPDEELISDVSIMIFDERGDAEECLWLRNGETVAEVPLVLGKTYSFRACANLGYRTFADHISELDEMTFYMAYPDEYSKGVPMYASVDGIRIGEEYDIIMNDGSFSAEATGVDLN